MALVVQDTCLECGKEYSYVEGSSGYNESWNYCDECIDKKKKVNELLELKKLLGEMKDGNRESTILGLDPTYYLFNEKLANLMVKANNMYFEYHNLLEYIELLVQSLVEKDYKDVEDKDSTEML